MGTVRPRRQVEGLLAFDAAFSCWKEITIRIFGAVAATPQHHGRIH